jgi:hypothetical protein
MRRKKCSQEDLARGERTTATLLEMAVYQPSEIRRGRLQSRRSDRCPLTARGTPILKQRNHFVEIGVASAEAPSEPVSTPLGNLLAVGHHVKLTSRAGSEQCCDAEALFYEGRETRDLGFIVLSGWTGDDFNFHSVPRNSVAG